ncbi:MAG: hypothetical protein ACLSWS_20020 [Faecalispora jeddahensis]
MDRLTYWCDNWHGGGKWFVAIDAEGREDYGPHVDRLAAYEETGLEPGEIEQLKGEVFGLRLDKQELEQYRALGPIDRLRELKQADDEGRCVVLPFKPPRWVYSAVRASPNRQKPIMQAPSMFYRIWTAGVYLGIPQGSRGRTAEGAGKGEGGRA